MKRPSAKRRIRRTAWACFALAFIIASVWLASGWLGCSYAWRSTRSVTLATGWVEYSHARPNGPVFKVPFELPSLGPADGWYLWSRAHGPRWRYDLLIESTYSHTTYAVPLWPIPLVLFAIGALLLFIIRPRLPYLCTNCRYDRRGIPASAPCPECGTLSQPTNTQT